MCYPCPRSELSPMSPVAQVCCPPEQTFKCDAAGLTLEAGDQLHVRAVAELVDGRHARKVISAGDENPGIARKRRRIARDTDDQRHLGGDELARLRLGTAARRVEDQRIV